MDTSDHLASCFYLTILWNVTGSHSNEQFSRRGFLIGDEKPPLSGLHHKLKPPESGRASPLVSAGQVLDKFFTMSTQPSRQASAMRPPTKMGIIEDNRQDGERGVCRVAWAAWRGGNVAWGCVCAACRLLTLQPALTTHNTHGMNTAGAGLSCQIQPNWFW